jgi:hypothetical protein
MQTSSPTLQLAIIQPATSQIMAIQQAYATFTNLQQQHGQTVPTGASAQAIGVPAQATEAPAQAVTQLPLLLPSSPANSNLPTVPSFVSEHGWLPKIGMGLQSKSPILKQSIIMNAAVPTINSANARQLDTDTLTPVIEYMPVGAGDAAGGAQSRMLPSGIDADDASYTDTSPACTNCTPLSVQHNPVQYSPFP